MIVLDDNNSDVEPTHLMVTLQWSQHDVARSMLVDDVHGALES